MKQIKYRDIDSYKYQLMERYIVNVSILSYDIVTQFVILQPSGQLTIGAFYTWDGASGPTIDTPNTMRGSLVHDALYQLMRKDLLPQENRADADLIFYKILLEDEMSRFRAWYYYKAVRWFAASCAKPKGEKTN